MKFEREPAKMDMRQSFRCFMVLTIALNGLCGFVQGDSSNTQCQGLFCRKLEDGLAQLKEVQFYNSNSRLKSNGGTRRPTRIRTKLFKFDRLPSRIQGVSRNM